MMYLSNHVNILAHNASEESPLHYAINKKSAKMLRVILQLVEDNQDNNNFFPAWLKLCCPITVRKDNSFVTKKTMNDIF